MLTRLILLVVAWLLVSPAAHAQEEDVGALLINAPTKGADVHIDYESVGTTPVTRYLPSGSYTVRIAADGYDPFVRRIDVAAGQTTELTAEFTGTGGTVEFFVPGGATLTINGNERPVPTRISDLDAGVFDYELNAPGKEPKRGSFTFKPGKNVLIYTELEGSTGKWEINSIPEGAAVHMDGEPIGQTPLSLSGVEPGLHTVGFVLDGYAVQFKDVDTSDGGKGKVNAKLKEDAAKYTIKTGDKDGRVFLDGVEIGSGKKVVAKLPKGKHDILVEADDQKSASVDIKVPAEGSYMYKAALAAHGAPEESTLLETKPLVKRWVFWTAVGAGAAGATGATVAVVAAAQPDPPPTGDVIATMP